MKNYNKLMKIINIAIIIIGLLILLTILIQKPNLNLIDNQTMNKIIENLMEFLPNFNGIKKIILIILVTPLFIYFGIISFFLNKITKKFFEYNNKKQLILVIFLIIFNILLIVSLFKYSFFDKLMNFYHLFIYLTIIELIFISLITLFLGILIYRYKKKIFKITTTRINILIYSLLSIIIIMVLYKIIQEIFYIILIKYLISLINLEALSDIPFLDITKFVNFQNLIPQSVADVFIKLLPNYITDNNLILNNIKDLVPNLNKTLDVLILTKLDAYLTKILTNLFLKDTVNNLYFYLFLEFTAIVYIINDFKNKTKYQTLISIGISLIIVIILIKIQMILLAVLIILIILIKLYHKYKKKEDYV